MPSNFMQDFDLAATQPDDYPGLPRIDFDHLQSAATLQTRLEAVGAHTLASKAPELYHHFSSVLVLTLKTYVANALDAVASTEVRIEDVMPKTFDAIGDTLTTMFPDRSSPLKDAILRLANTLLVELRDLTGRLVDAWLVFFERYFWECFEHGVDDFDTFAQFVHSEFAVPLIAPLKLHLVGAQDAEMHGHVERQLEVLCERLGASLFGLGLVFRNQLRQLVKQSNTDIAECQILTPQVCYLQVARLKVGIEGLIGKTRHSWPLFDNAREETRAAWFRDLIENVDNAPAVRFEGEGTVVKGEEAPAPSKLAQQNGHLTLKGDSIKRREMLKPILNDTEPSEIALPENHIVEQPTNEMNEKTDPANTTKATSDQENSEVIFEDPFESEQACKIRTFLEARPDLNKKRLEAVKKLQAEISSRRRESVYTLVNRDGVGARCFVLDEGDLVLLRKDPSGQEILSKGVNSSWLKLNMSEFVNGDFSLGLAKQVDRKSAYSNLQNMLHQKIAKVNIDTMSTGIGSMTGSFGEMLYEIVEGKKEFSEISKGFIFSTGQDFLLSVFTTTVPFVAISMAGLLGAYGFTKLLQNKLMTPQRKAKVITEIFLRSGTRSAIAIGSAILGNIIVPVPVFGAILGSVIGGFAGSAIFAALRAIMKNKIMLEPFVFYCLAKLQTHGKWNKERVTIYPVELFEGFCRTISYVCPLEPSALESFVNDQREGFHTLMESLFIRIAEEPEDSKTRPEDHVVRWKTLIAFCLISYFHFILSVRFAEQTQVSSAFEEIYLGSISKFGDLVELSAVSTFIAESFKDRLDGHVIINKALFAITEYVKEERIMSLVAEPIDEKKIGDGSHTDNDHQQVKQLILEKGTGREGPGDDKGIEYIGEEDKPDSSDKKDRKTLMDDMDHHHDLGAPTYDGPDIPLAPLDCYDNPTASYM